MIIDIPDGVPKDPTKDTCNAITSKPESVSPGMFRGLIPETSKKAEAGTNDAFECAEEEAQNHQ